MMRARNVPFGSSRRPAAAVVMTVVLLGVIFGVAALTIDVGMMFNARHDLQCAADAGALAAVQKLADLGSSDAAGLARIAAAEQVAKNRVLNKQAEISPDTDVVIGRAMYNDAKQSFDFTPTSLMADAVLVRVRLATDSPGGPLPLTFAKIFGRSHVDVSAEAIAYLAPRDVAVTVDLSGSLSDDSELQNYKKTDVNLYDVWASLPSNDGIGNLDPALNTLAPGSLDGPAWGYMRLLGFGDGLDAVTYDPAADPGLIRLPYQSNWNDAALTTTLAARGYNATEINAIMSASYDQSGQYPDRTAVALGLADWDSGVPGGRSSVLGLPSASSGNGDSRLGSGEMRWVEPIFNYSQADSTTVWRDYMTYMRSSRTAMTRANVDFQYRYGIKSFVNFLLEKRGSNADTPELADTPVQPMQSVKDAVAFMGGLLYDLETNDQLSLEVYATTARHEIDLTNDFPVISQRLNQMQAGHYDPYTNMGGGMESAIAELTSVRARAMSRKVLLVLTDGIANVNESGQVGDTLGGKAYALAAAQRAADLGIQIFSVSVGSGADQQVMADIAAIGNGVHYHVEGDIASYSAGLAEVFQRIGSSRAPELIR